MNIGNSVQLTTTAEVGMVLAFELQRCSECNQYMQHGEPIRAQVHFDDRTEWLNLRVLEVVE